MNDRVSAYPGRIKLTDESTGISKYYTMEMADEPSEYGTPLDKAHLLSDETVAAILAKCGEEPEDINGALSLLNGKLMKVKMGTYQGAGSLDTTTVQTITGIGFTPFMVVLSGSGAGFWHQIVLTSSMGTTGERHWYSDAYGVNYVYSSISMTNGTVRWVGSTGSTTLGQRYWHDCMNTSGYTYTYLAIGY